MNYNPHRPFPNVKRIRLGNYIERSTVNNNDLRYNEKYIVGVTNEGVFASPKGDLLDYDLKPYKIVKNGAFVYNPTRLSLGSIAYRTEGLCIVSHLYIVFYLNAEGLKNIDPMFLYMYFRRTEFYREVAFRNFGSQRPEFSYKDMCEIEIPLPDITIQQKCVAIYNSMMANQKSYEYGLNDLKLTCDAYIESLKRKYTSETIGIYLQQKKEKNSDKSIDKVMGLSTKKEFREAQSRVNKNELGNYKIVEPDEIAFVPTTDTWKVLAFAQNEMDEKVVVSPIYEVFSINKQALNPVYLSLWLSRKEFDRYARYHSWGSARENFSFEDMCNVKIPIPEKKIQDAIAELFLAYKVRKRINEKLKESIRNICPILIRGSLNYGGRNDGKVERV